MNGFAAFDIMCSKVDGAGLDAAYKTLWRYTNMTAGIDRKTRYEVYRRDGFACVLCGSGSHLQIHHYEPRGEGGSDFPENLVTLCSICHAQIHGFIPYEGEDYTAEWANQTLLEYLADYYAEDGWYPYK